jgi:hypothetical protein
MWWGTGFALDAGQDSSRHLEDSMDCVGSGGRTIRDGGTDGKQNKNMIQNITNGIWVIFFKFGLV